MIKIDDFSSANIENLKGLQDLADHVFNRLDDLLDEDTPKPILINQEDAIKLERYERDFGPFNSNNIGGTSGTGAGIGSGAGAGVGSGAGSGSAGSGSAGSGSGSGVMPNPAISSSSGLIIEFSKADEKEKYYDFDLNIKEGMKPCEEDVFAKFVYPNKIIIYKINIRLAGNFEARVAAAVVRCFCNYYHCCKIEAAGGEWDPNANPSAKHRYTYPPIIQESLATYFELMQLDELNHIFPDMPILKEEITAKFTRKVLLYPKAGAKLIKDVKHFAEVEKKSFIKNNWAKTMAVLLKTKSGNSKFVIPKLKGI